MRSGENQHRIPKKIHNHRQPCPCTVDCIGHVGFLANQHSRRRSISPRSLNRRLRRSQISWVPATMLQLQKMHLRHGQTIRLILWQTQPKRLQTNLSPAHRPILLRINRSIPSCIRSRLHNSRVYNSQNWRCCFSIGAFNLQCLNLADTQSMRRQFSFK